MCLIASSRKPSTRIEPEAVDPGGVEIPFSPPEQLGAHLFVLEIEIAAHQIGKIASLQRNVIVELLAVEQVDHTRFSGFRVVIDGVEVLPAPLERRVLALAAGEGETGVHLDFSRLTARMHSVVLEERNGPRRFRSVAANAVVEHGVGVDLEAGGAQRGDGPEILLAGSILGANGTFLLEFAEVIQVIDAVTNISIAIDSLVGRWQPHTGKPQVAATHR